MLTRQLRVALLISFIVHLAGLVLFSIALLPKGFLPRQYASVGFLGSILNTPPAASQNGTQKANRVAEGLRAPAIKFSTQPSLPAERAMLALDDFIDLDKPIEKMTVAADSNAAAGSQGAREVIFQPPLPAYPELGEGQFQNSSLVFEVYISADGLVQEVKNIQASGNPEMDAILARYIRRWRFAPAIDGPGQWQTVKIDRENQGLE